MNAKYEIMNVKRKLVGLLILLKKNKSLKLDSQSD